MFPTEVGEKDTLVISVAGVAGSGAGRMTQAANGNFSLAAFLDKYGSGSGSDTEGLKPLTPEDMKKIIEEEGPTGIAKALANIVQAVSGSGSEPLSARVLAAVCEWLTGQGFILSKDDPGENKFYLDPDDLNISVSTGPSNGTYAWFVTGAASFG